MKPLIGLFFRGVGLFVYVLPRRVQMGIGAVIGLLWFDVFRIRRKVALDNLSLAFPEKSLLERTAIARESLVHLGRTLVEFALFPYLRSENLDRHFEFQGTENVERALRDGKGVFLLTLHVGNGDFAVAGLSLLGWPINMISKEFKTRWLNDLWFGMRRRVGTRFISPEKSSFDILRAIKRGEIVVFVLDQFMGPPVGVRTRFFGRETGTAAGLALMASRTQAPVIPCYVYRLASGRHVAVFEAPLSGLDDRLTEKNIPALTQAYTDKIEEIVRRHPGQWMWIHRRWKEFRD